MKKLLAVVLTLACVFGLLGCANENVKVWDWAQHLTQEDITAVIPWRHDAEYEELEPLNEEEIRRLVTLLNNLTKKSFTENKNLVGITATVGIRIEVASETYNLIYAPSPYEKYGELEIGYGEKPWWINNAELLAFFETVTGSQSAE